MDIVQLLKLINVQSNVFIIQNTADGNTHTCSCKQCFTLRTASPPRWGRSRFSGIPVMAFSSCLVTVAGLRSQAQTLNVWFSCLVSHIPLKLTLALYSVFQTYTPQTKPLSWDEVISFISSRCFQKEIVSLGASCLVCIVQDPTCILLDIQNLKSPKKRSLKDFDFHGL